MQAREEALSFLDYGHCHFGVSEPDVTIFEQDGGAGEDTDWVQLRT